MSFAWKIILPVAALVLMVFMITRPYSCKEDEGKKDKEKPPSEQQQNPNQASQPSPKKIEVALLAPPTYGGPDGKGFYIWAPPLPSDGTDSKDPKAWSVRIWANGETERDKAYWNLKPDHEPTADELKKLLGGSDHDWDMGSRLSPWTRPEMVHASGERAKYLLTYPTPSIPVWVVINDEFDHPHDLPLKAVIGNVRSIRFQSKDAKKGTWIPISWWLNTSK